MTFLWVCRSPKRLSSKAREIYEDPDNELFLSAASAFEIVIKSMLGRLDLGGPPGEFVRTQRERRAIVALPFDEESASALERLPAIHADPFDRLLIGASIVHGLTILTPDATIA